MKEIQPFQPRIPAISPNYDKRRYILHLLNTVGNLGAVVALIVFAWTVIAPSMQSKCSVVTPIDHPPVNELKEI